MDEYPDPDEEFQLMYEDDLELLNEMENDPARDAPLRPNAAPPTRRSLNFNSPKAQSPAFSSTQKSVTPSDSKKVPGPESCLQVDITPLSQSSDSGKKRTIDDIFGDIDDIEMEEALQFSLTGPKTKRSRTHQPADLFFFPSDDQGLESCQDPEVDLINKITALRKQAFLESEQGRLSSTPGALKFSKNKNVITKGVPKWPFVSITSELGQRTYIRVRSEDYFDEECRRVSHQGRETGLLRVPYRSLKEAALKLLEEKQESNIVAQEAEIAALTSTVEEAPGRHTDGGELWVQKYKPRTYAELLSEESINRTLLHWLKLWDKVVFNHEKKVHQKPKEDPKGDNRQNRFQKKPYGQVLSDQLDEHGRPEYKMVLLCGPPGLGKTTLAHMVANLAGYNVVEVNASDDRSPEAFRTQLEAATQMRSVLGKDPRPNCLVLDEIDGAPAVSIETLVKFVLGKDVGKGRGKKKGNTPGILKRPVICVCNDAYVPALRPLRQLAYVVHFPPTGSDRLATRLLEIARKQKIKTDMGAMLALCEKTQNDIRSCLSSLHYFKAQGRPVRLVDIQRSNVGQKDVQKGLFSIWQEIFQIRRSKGGFTHAERDSSGHADTPEVKSGDFSLATRMQHVHRAVQSHGDYERLAQGVFENYPNMKLKDSSLEGLVKGLDWFCTVDLLSTEIHSSQNYILMPYMSYAFVVWHLLYAGLAWPKISYPSAAYEASVKQTHIRQIIGEVMNGMSPCARVNCNILQLVLHTLPMLSDIIVPNLRPVSIQLYSSREKQELTNLISIMIDYNLTYIQERTPEGSYVCKLDPNIEEVVFLGGHRAARFLKYSTKQLLAREIEIEKMRRFEMQSNVPRKEQTPKVPESKGDVQEKPAVKKTSPSTVPNHLRKLKAKPVLVEMQTKDFFGRIVNIPVSPSTVKARTEEKLKGDIWFHFKEGFNNAVRKTVKMADLL